MSPLPESMRRLGEEVVAYYAQAYPGRTPPYLVYVYPPKEEFAVRRDLNDLRPWLGARGVECAAISLAELFWEAIDGSGFAEEIVAEEERAGGDPSVLATVHTTIWQILNGPPSLADRVLGRLKDLSGWAAVFLYRAGALFPSYRTSALLDDLRERLTAPVVLLYPGRLVGAYGLSFMGRCEPAHGYRAKIIAREGA
ncbi:MAG TPA: BREX protein BrxB domain-containing protein [Actinomycetota bacterium]|nr:BREX protein BrxB domain-containing protein [Actinomycetota bacterium]